MALTKEEADSLPPQEVIERCNEEIGATPDPGEEGSHRAAVVAVANKGRRQRRHHRTRCCPTNTGVCRGLRSR